jgi:hypothetical protein
MDCSTFNDCQSADYQQFDCNCDRKCYLLNAPTPRPATLAPSPLRAPTPGLCDTQRDAWNRVAPPGFSWGSGFTAGYISYDSFDLPAGSGQLIPQALALSAADQATLIDFVCCISCRYYGTQRFNNRLFQAYQLDCTKKTVTKLDDTCDDQRNSLAILGCWAPIVSSASTAVIGVGALLFTALLC